MMTRSLTTIVFVVTLALGVGASRADAVVSQPVSGLGAGALFIDCLACPAQGHVDQGRYVSVGQLGSGNYSFAATIESSCGAHGEGHEIGGKATFFRSDGAQLSGDFTGCAISGLPLSIHLSEGTRDLAGADLTVTIVNRGNTVAIPDGDRSDEQMGFVGRVTVTERIGYWMLDSSGRVYGFGGADQHGNAPTPTAARHLARTPSGGGYWVVNAFGQVYAFGDARWLGNANTATLSAGEQVTSISATPTGRGYWLFTTRGRVLPFGDAQFHGDMHNVRLTGPVVSSIATPTGGGYYMVATDGGVFAFGDARFRGSMASRPLSAPVITLVPTAGDGGYWLVASDGGVFSFSAAFRGSMGGRRLNAPIAGMDRYGDGYVMVATDGGVFNFSSRPFYGSLGAFPPAHAVVDLASVG